MPTRKYALVGPVELPRDGKQLSKESIKQQEFGSDEDELLVDTCKGCYVFGIKWGSKITPWYVGMTNGQSLRKEATADSNLLKYNGVLAKRAGTPVLFYLPRLTAGGKPTKQDLKGELENVEFLLIGAALDENEDLLNKKKLTFLTELEVPGLFNVGKGKPTSAAAAFRSMLGFG